MSTFPISFENYRERIKKLNGANLILTNENQRILFFRSTYGEKKLMLPGGAIERNEIPEHAAQSELEEECALLVEQDNMKLVGTLVQKISGVPDITGFLFLYTASSYIGEPHPTEEASEFFWLTPEEIFIERSEEIGLGYKRMIARYLDWKDCGISAKGRLGDQATVCIDGKKIAV